ncbi:MAG TPA: hypothetical protein VHY83_09370 [Solirubrobacteraceae bacterium]|nr:hypothetical protein [Solirubrobacteraceae bacterium]
MVPLASASGLVIFGAWAPAAVVLVIVLFRAEDPTEAEERAEAERRSGSAGETPR